MSRIHTNVMASVLLIYWGRKMLSPRALKLYALALAGVAVMALVSIQNVLANLMAVGLDGVGTFLYAAIANTTPVVQVSTLIAFVMAALLVRDVAVSSRALS